MQTFLNLLQQGQQSKAFIALRAVAGVLLLAAASLKAYQLITGPAIGTFWWDARPWQALAIGAEVLLAGWMFSGLAPRITRFVGLALFGLLGVLAFIKALGGEASCGCFGALVVSPWITLVIDACLLTGFGLVFPVYTQTDRREEPEPSHQPKVRSALPWALVALAGVSGVGLGAWTMAVEPAQLQLGTGELLGAGDYVELEPERWIGHPFPLFAYTDLPDEVGHGSWWVMLYSPTCKHCIDAIPKIRAVAQAGQPVALLAMPSYQEDELVFPEGVFGRLNRDREWYAQTPVMVELKDGIVVRAAQGAASYEWF